MRLRLGNAAALAAFLLIAACSGEPPPAAVGAPPGGPMPPVTSASKEPERTYLPPTAYDARHRRDPFKPLVTATADVKKAPAPLEGFRLVGVMSGPSGLIALVEGADGIGYIVRPGDVLGGGRVTQITGDAVRFAVAAPRPGQASELTLRLQTN
jgi:hypothetical protein